MIVSTLAFYVVPDPIRVSINNPSGGPLFIPRGVTTNISLICSVILDPLIDIPVRVNYHWYRSDFPRNSMSKFIGQYNVNMTTISLLTLQKAGVYTCEVTVMPTPANMFIEGTGGHTSTTNVSLCEFTNYSINFFN